MSRVASRLPEGTERFHVRVHVIGPVFDVWLTGDRRHASGASHSAPSSGLWVGDAAAAAAAVVHVRGSCCC